MHWNHWRGGAVAAVLLSAPPVIAQDCAETLLDKVKPDQNAQAAFVALAECIVEQQQRIGELETKLTNMRLTNVVPAVGAHEDTKAIVAFTSEKGEKTCPEGWAPFEAAKDRFLLGAGGKYPVVGTTGGEEMETLTHDQMPEHYHGFLWVFSAQNGGANEFDSSNFPTFRSGLNTAGRWQAQSDRTPIKNSGGNQPHNNMPPYIALYFCIKS